MSNKKEKTHPTDNKVSKKEISKTVYEKIAGSLAEFNLHGKKFDNKLKKVSKLFAVDIAKANRKEVKKREKAEATATVAIAS